MNKITDFLLKEIDLYSQILFVVAAFLSAYLVSRIIHKSVKKFKNSKLKHKDFFKENFYEAFDKFNFPLVFLTLLSIAELYFKSGNVIKIAKSANVIWLLLVLAKNFIDSFFARLMILWILIPALTLKIFKVFHIVREVFEELSFTIGDTKITSYAVIKTLLFFSIAIWIVDIIGDVGRKYIKRIKSINSSTKELFIKVFNIFLYVSVFAITLEFLGIDLTVLKIFGGAVGVGIGFGLQKIASNFISGVILLSEKSVGIDNLVEIDGVLGYVRRLGARAAILETFEGRKVTVPNEDFITSKVINFTQVRGAGRVDIAVGVSYDSDLNKVKEIMLNAVNKEYKKILKGEEFATQCYLEEYGDNSVNFLLRFWPNSEELDRRAAKSDVMFIIWNRFKEHNIEIPFPQRDLHIKGEFPPLTKAKVNAKTKASKVKSGKKS